MPRVNGRFMSMEEFERWEAEQLRRDEAPRGSGLDFKRKLNEARGMYAKHRFEEMEAMRVNSGGALQNLEKAKLGADAAAFKDVAEAFGFRFATKWLRAASPKAQQIFLKYGRNW